MSSSTLPLATITMLDNALVFINRYLGIFIFIFGTMGNILNILILRQRPFRSNPCSWFFLISSTMSFVPYICGIISRILSDWNIIFINANSLVCKVRGLMIFAFPTMFLWIITLSTIDRWLASSLIIYLRQKSTLKNAQRSTILVICLSMILSIQMLICEQVDLIGIQMICHSKSTKCRLIGDLSFVLISILCPLILMVLFGILTISNVRKACRQICSFNENQLPCLNHRQRQQKRMDHQLLIMLFVQIGSLTISCLPYVVYILYSTITYSDSRTLLEKTIVNFFFNVVILILYAALGLPFYIYTLSGGKIFRKTLLNVLKTFYHKILCK